jgi:3-methylcrotonyl-CoA carboxylase alpha subunit
MHGHAIEARICAENPDNQFLPATGTLRIYRKPAHGAFAHADVRFDDGVREGDAISPFYDSMIAKLIVHGDTREQALARLDAALAQTHIVGLATNVQFLRHVVKSRSFAQADLDTALIPREQAVLFHQQPVAAPTAAAAAVALTLMQEQAAAMAAGSSDPFARRDHWRSHGSAQRRFAFESDGAALAAQLEVLHDGALLLSVGEARGPLQWRALPALAHGEGDASALEFTWQGRTERIHAYRHGEEVHVFAAAGAARITQIDLLAHAGDTAEEGGRLSAPMPGKVVSFAVKPGDKVSKGQPLAVMEAMKMEHTIAAPADGTVAELLYAPGDQVLEGAELLKLSA